jgi:hypothetical protein
VLLRRANLAADHGFHDLTEEFRFLYLDEMVQTLCLNFIVDRQLPEGTPRGYLILKLEGQEQVDEAVAMLNRRRGTKGPFLSHPQTALFGPGEKRK